MADTTTTKNVLSVIATTSSKIKELTIKNGQLIFIQDLGRIAFDFNSKRVFYNDIIELDTEFDRTSLESPIQGKFYFVIESAILYRYYNEWIQISSKPEEVVFIDVTLPELGKEKVLYVNKEKKEISVWDKETQNYDVVADRTMSMTPEDVIALFN